MVFASRELAGFVLALENAGERGGGGYGVA